jgi:hypothetical protein
MINLISKKTSLTTKPMRSALLATLLAATVAAVSAQDAKQSKNENDELTPNQKLIVNVVDLTGFVNIETDFIRENLLESAFYNAATEEDWLGGFEFRYNYSVPQDRGGYLEFNVIDWERSAANFYNFTATAHYRTVGGERINLGTFHGIESGITVTTGWDVGDAFRDAAETAFSEALDELKKETVAI